MSDQLIVERGGLEKKDKGELQAIVSALGGSPSSRARKADLIDQIIELSQQAAPTGSDDGGNDDGASEGSSAGEADPTAGGEDPAEPAGDEGASEPTAQTDADQADAPDKGSVADASPPKASSSKAATDSPDAASGQQGSANRGGRGQRGSRSGRRSRSDAHHPVGPDGEPLADWEIELADGEQGADGSNQKGGGRNKDRNRDSNPTKDSNNRDAPKDGNRGGGNDVDPNNRRGRRRGRGRGRDRDDAGNDPISTEPIAVAGSLDLRDEGYGFLRVAGYLPSKEDVYVSVKQVRQYGLRKGDHLTGLSRPANRNEKNPGFHQIDTVKDNLGAERLVDALELDLRCGFLDHSVNRSEVRA